MDLNVMRACDDGYPSCRVAEAGGEWCKKNCEAAKSVRKLSSNELHLLKLINRGIQANGWAPVSKEVYPLVHMLPRRLIECGQTEDGNGTARLTPEGRGILDALKWLT